MFLVPNLRFCGRYVCAPCRRAVCAVCSAGHRPAGHPTVRHWALGHNVSAFCCGIPAGLLPHGFGRPCHTPPSAAHATAHPHTSATGALLSVFEAAPGTSSLRCFVRALLRVVARRGVVMRYTPTRRHSCCGTALYHAHSVQQLPGAGVPGGDSCVLGVRTVFLRLFAFTTLNCSFR